VPWKGPYGEPGWHPHFWVKGTSSWPDRDEAVTRHGAAKTGDALMAGIIGCRRCELGLERHPTWCPGDRNVGPGRRRRRDPWRVADVPRAASCGGNGDRFLDFVSDVETAACDQGEVPPMIAGRAPLFPVMITAASHQPETVRSAKI
jgi:hypothetical protein